MFDCLLGWYTVHFSGLLTLKEFCHVQNSLCVKVLRSPILATLLHGSRAVGVSQTVRRDTRNGITELSLLVISASGSESPLTKFRQLENSLQMEKTKTNAFDFLNIAAMHML